MLQDEITLELFQEIKIEILDELNVDLDFDLSKMIYLTVNVESERSIVVDLEGMGLDVGNIILRLFGKVDRPFSFGKDVLGTKTTFGSLSTVIDSGIQINGIAEIDPDNHNILSVPITLGKSVSGHKTTFGSLSSVITNDIETVATNSSGNIDFYGDGLYGADTYGILIGYGSGAYGFGVYSGPSSLLAIGFNSTISGDVITKETQIVEVSLASHGEPYLRTNHRIKVRARTTSGSSGVLKAELYEGSTSISGELTTPNLTNTLSTYDLDISEALASLITDYSDLSIRFWGYDSAGNALVFEVADIYLELPIGSGGVTYYGSVSRSITFTKAVSGNINSKRTTTAEVSLGSHDLPYVRTNHSIKLRARTTSGSSGVLKAALYEGAVNRSGDLITEPLTNTFVDYTLIIPNYLAATITDYSNLSIRLWGFDYLGNALVFEVADIYLELPISNGNVTQYGSVSRGITFNKAVSGIVNSKRTTTAEISLASHGTPSSRTSHSIKLRARTTTGSTGVLKAELYEGATKRSGATPLSTSALTTSLADYSLSISDSDAATITDYSNLSIKFWGFDSAGNALVFEVSEIYLELPTA